MKLIKPALLASAAIIAPLGAQAANVTLTTQLKSYSGPGAYAAYYVTDASGNYVGSLWMAGGKARYYRDLPGWFRATGGNTAEVSGITGASIGSGQTQTIKLDLAVDKVFDQGYQLHIDTSVEKGGTFANDVVIDLTSANSGKAVSGKGYIDSFTITK